MVPQYAPGMLIPFIYENLPLDEAKALVPKLDTYYLIKTTKTCALPVGFTGRAMGNIIFINGVAKVKTLYEKRLLLMRGCVDDTPEWMIKQLKARDLKRILVIRNAAFGDVTILTPAFNALRERYPQALIHFYGREDSRDIMLFNNLVDAIIDIRTTEIGHLLPMYDEVYDLVHSIECNAAADHRAAIDVAHDLLMLDQPKGVKNSYVIAKQELDEAQRALFTLGIDPSRNNLIVFQYEGTALARSLSPLTVFKVANALANKGLQVLLWSHRMDFFGYQFYRCTETNGLSAQPITGNKEQIIKLKNKLGNETDHELLALHPAVKHVLQKPDGSQMTYGNRRSKFAICYFARHIVSVDSFISHLADALEKSSTVVFTNYHPYTRTKYYKNCDVVTADFENDLLCGPCNGLLNDCPFNKNSLPFCSLKVKAEDIIDKVMMRLHGVLPLHEDLRDNPPVPENYCSVKHVCKVCKSDHTHLITVKGTIPFHRCLDCYSIFASQPPKTRDVKHLKVPFYSVIRNIENQLDFMNLVTMAAKEKKLDFEVADIVRVSDLERTGKYAFEPFKNFTEYLMDNKELLPKLSLMIGMFSEFETPEEAMQFLDARTEVGHKIVTTMYNAEHWDHSNTWSPTMQPIAGINQVIYSQEGIVRMFAKDTGTHASRYKIIGAIDVTKDIMMYCFERVS